MEQSDGVFCDLCETWEVSPDGTTYTGRFQSEGYAKDMGAPGFGTELGCEDVKHSMEWFAASGGNGGQHHSRGQGEVGHLDNITCPDGPQGNCNLRCSGTPPIWDKEYKEWMEEHPAIQSTGEEIGYLLDMDRYPNPTDVVHNPTTG